MATTLVAVSAVPESTDNKIVIMEGGRPMDDQDLVAAAAAAASSLLMASSESLWRRLREEAIEAVHDEPQMRFLLNNTILAPTVNSFEEAVAMTVAFRLLGGVPCHPKASSLPTDSSSSTTTTTHQSDYQQQQQQQAQPVFCPHTLYGILKEALFNSEQRVMGHTVSQAVQSDVLAVIDRDPACDTLLEVVLFMKGFSALVSHRVAHQKWMLAKAATKSKKSWTALFLQSQASAVFGVDIHPGARLGAGILLDHGTGIVIGETAVVGDGCTLLHGVTLGGTGKDHGDRHPKIGPHVLIGAGAKILGNIPIGAAAKIGAGSIVLRAIPAGATAVGAPAKIIGRALELDPAQNNDSTLDQVGMLHKSLSDRTLTTVRSNSSTTAADDDDDEEEESDGDDVDDAGGQSPSIDDNGVGLSDTTVTTASMAVTKNGTSRDHHQSQKSSSIDNRLKDRHGDPPPGCVCPYRDYARMALSAPKGSITICTLSKLLRPYESTTHEVGGTFFELDTLNVGHFYWDAVHDRVAASLQNNTRLSTDQIATVLEHLRIKHQRFVSTAVAT